MNEPIGFGFFFGDNPLGFGDPFGGVATGVVAPADGVVPDDGAVVVTLSGAFGAGPYRVLVAGIQAYGGVAGGGDDCWPSSAGTRLTCVPRAPLPLGSADIELHGPEGVQLLSGVLTVVRRHRRQLAYLLERFASPLGPHRARGPVDPLHDEVLDP